MATVTVLTGAYPTTAPSGLPGSVVQVDTIKFQDGANFTIKVASGTDTFYGLGYHLGLALWLPLVTLATDSSVTGGIVHGRVRSIGRPTPAYTHFAIWRSGGSVTPTVADVENVRGES